MQGADSVFAEDVILSDSDLGATSNSGLSRSNHYDVRQRRPGQLMSSPGRHTSVSMSAEGNTQYQVAMTIAPHVRRSHDT